MLEWHEYMEQLLQDGSALNGLSLSFDEGQSNIGTPPIIKASILMLDRMIEHQGKYNIVVFPERVQSLFLFTLMKLLHNIDQGKIEINYDPAIFSPGEKLKLGNAVVEFLGTEERDNKPCLVIRLADLTTSAPVEFFPFFQRTNTQRGLSKYALFVSAKKEAEGRMKNLSPDERQLAALADYKTHISSSIFYMSSIIRTKEMISNFRMCGKSIGDILLIGQTDFNGDVRNVGPGQLAGTPSIVLAADIYAILAASSKGNPVQSVILDVSDSNKVLAQIDQLDEMMRLGIPITCVTDFVNSFDLQSFQMRGFHVWRWDKTSITPNLYGTARLPLEKKAQHCATRSIVYQHAEGPQISSAMRRLSTHRNEVSEASAQMMRIYDTLNALAFATLRQIVPLGDSEAEQAQLRLQEAAQALAEEKPYLSSEQYADFQEVIDCLLAVSFSGYSPPKLAALSDCLLREDYDKVCMIVPEKTDKEQVRIHWQIWCDRNSLRTTVHVLYPAEYHAASSVSFSVTVVVGWFRRAVMRKILYSFHTKAYLVLLYDCEQRWKNYDTGRWEAAIRRSDNQLIVERSLSNETLRISTARFLPAPDPVPDTQPDGTPLEDELGEIDLVLRENKFRQYIASGGTKEEDAIGEAIPVNYVGGFLAFYRSGHKLISATNVILEDADKVDFITPDKLRVGDFVVVREADRDLIKEMADLLLAKSGKSDLRAMATKWKDALIIEQVFSTPEEIHKKLQDAGCTRGIETIRRWLTSEDAIGPQLKQDFAYIAAITKNSVMNELLDQIFDASQEVKAAHTQAGLILSAQLRSKIVHALEHYGEIDPFNIWEPIEMSMDGIGIVRVLKVIDVGTSIVVKLTDTNRLIEE